MQLHVLYETECLDLRDLYTILDDNSQHLTMQSKSFNLALDVKFKPGKSKTVETLRHKMNKKLI